MESSVVFVPSGFHSRTGLTRKSSCYTLLFLFKNKLLLRVTNFSKQQGYLLAAEVHLQTNPGRQCPAFPLSCISKSDLFTSHIALSHGFYARIPYLTWASSSRLNVDLHRDEKINTRFLFLINNSIVFFFFKHRVIETSEDQTKA